MNYIQRHYYNGTISIRVAKRPKVRVMKEMARAARRECREPVKKVQFWIRCSKWEWQKIGTM